MRGQGAAGARNPRLGAVLVGHEAGRMVASNSAFTSLLPWAMEGRPLASAGPKLRGLDDIFAEDRAGAFLAVRNPATCRPAVLAQSRGGTSRPFAGAAEPPSP
jgi:hypothetical protein